jgi:hypothetical protein
VILAACGMIVSVFEVAKDKLAFFFKKLFELASFGSVKFEVN